MKEVPRFQVITDEQLQSRFSHLEISKLALAGGADAVQYREKRLRSTAELVGTASQLQSGCAQLGRLLIVNDRADVCVAAEVGGLHVGREDLDVGLARRLVGPQVLIGSTANSVAEAYAAASKSPDYLGVGPVFGTSSKANPAPKLGLKGLREICSAVSIPVIAIGNIQPDNIASLVDAGAHGFAVLAGVTCALKPDEATANYRSELDRVLGS